MKVLQQAEGVATELIPIVEEEGISVLAFGLKEPLDQYGKEVAELGMDSTCALYSFRIM